MKALCIVLILVGVYWLLDLAWTYLVMSGISTPAVPAVFLYYGTRSIGPILLIVGPILVLNQAHKKLGVLLTAIGCTIITVLIGSSIVEFLHVEPLQRKPDFGDYTRNAFLALVVLLSDWAAFRLYQLTFLAAK